MKIKNKIDRKKIISLAAIFIIIAILFVVYIFLFNKGTTYTYGTIEVHITYEKTNYTREEIMAIIEQNENITIIERDEGIFSFKMLGTSLTEDELNRTHSLLGLPNERSGFELMIEYKTEKPFSEDIYNKADKAEWEERVDIQYNLDKQILDAYTFSLTSYLNETFNTNFQEIEYGPKYFAEE